MATTNRQEMGTSAVPTKAKPTTRDELRAATRMKDYVPQSAGLAAGTEGEDVERLQRYLAQFGYLESPSLDDFGERAGSVGAIERPGVFDAPTEGALRRFQEFVGLPPTRRLDERTLERMARPRCGFPDQRALAQVVERLRLERLGVARRGAHLVAGRLVVERGSPRRVRARHRQRVLAPVVRVSPRAADAGRR
jgi:peptidoglycan hydrolase-like protein with peptidoglycan-binding domain